MFSFSTQGQALDDEQIGRNAWSDVLDGGPHNKKVTRVSFKVGVSPVVSDVASRLPSARHNHALIYGAVIFHSYILWASLLSRLSCSRRIIHKVYLSVCHSLQYAWIVAATPRSVTTGMNINLVYYTGLLLATQRRLRRRQLCPFWNSSVASTYSRTMQMHCKVRLSLCVVFDASVLWQNNRG